MTKRIYIYIVILMMLAGCGTKKEVSPIIPQESVPTWHTCLIRNAQATVETEGMKVNANITMQAMGYADYAYDFTEQETYEWLESLIGQVAMCGMTILNMDYSLYSFLLFLQNAWDDRMPVYAIQRDPVTYYENGLLVDVLTSNGFTSSLGGDLSEIGPGE